MNIVASWDKITKSDCMFCSSSCIAELFVPPENNDNLGDIFPVLGQTTYAGAHSIHNKYQPYFNRQPSLMLFLGKQ